MNRSLLQYRKPPVIIGSLSGYEAVTLRICYGPTLRDTRECHLGGVPHDHDTQDQFRLRLRTELAGFLSDSIINDKWPNDEAEEAQDHEQDT